MRRRSDVITQGLTRAPHRAFLHGLGLSDEDIQKPQIAVIGPFGELTPCNAHLSRLAACARSAIAGAGGVARLSGLAMVADSLSMNHQGMKFSLISRELMADSIEAVIRGHAFDAMVGFAGCDSGVVGINLERR